MNWLRFGLWWNIVFVLWDAFFLGLDIRTGRPLERVVLAAICFGFQSGLLVWTFSMWCNQRWLDKQRREVESEIQAFDRQMEELRRKAGL